MAKLDRILVGLIFVGLGWPANAKRPDLPSRKVISRIETGLALERHLQEVGVWGTTAHGLNSAARRKVRQARCNPSDEDTAVCTYLVEGEGWKTNRFERSDEQMPSALAHGGWKLVSP